MEDKEQILQKLNSEIKNSLDEFRGLPDSVSVLSSTLDQRMSSTVELFLKEIIDISLISVTAAPFSLTILLSFLTW